MLRLRIFNGYRGDQLPPRHGSGITDAFPLVLRAAFTEAWRVPGLQPGSLPSIQAHLGLESALGLKRAVPLLTGDHRLTGRTDIIARLIEVVASLFLCCLAPERTYCVFHQGLGWDWNG